MLFSPFLFLVIPNLAPSSPVTKLSFFSHWDIYTFLCLECSPQIFPLASFVTKFRYLIKCHLFRKNWTPQSYPLPFIILFIPSFCICYVFCYFLYSFWFLLYNTYVIDMLICLFSISSYQNKSTIEAGTLSVCLSLSLCIFVVVLIFVLLLDLDPLHSNLIFSFFLPTATTKFNNLSFLSVLPRFLFL